MGRRAMHGVVFVSLLAGLALAACGGGTSSTGGKLSVDHDKYDFGQVPLGELKEHSFIITNTGSGVLELQKEATVMAVEGC